MDDKVKAAIAGFNFGLMGYLLIRSLPTIFGTLVIDGSWMAMQFAIGAVIGLVLGGIAYVAVGQLQK